MIFVCFGCFSVLNFSPVFLILVLEKNFLLKLINLTFLTNFDKKH